MYLGEQTRTALLKWARTAFTAPQLRQEFARVQDDDLQLYVVAFNMDPTPVGNDQQFRDTLIVVQSTGSNYWVEIQFPPAAEQVGAAAAPVAAAAAAPGDDAAWYQRLLHVASDKALLKGAPFVHTEEEARAQREKGVVVVVRKGLPSHALTYPPEALEGEPRLVEWTCQDCPARSPLAKKVMRCLVGDIKYMPGNDVFQRIRNLKLRSIYNHLKGHVGQRARGVSEPTSEADVQEDDDGDNRVFGKLDGAGLSGTPKRSSQNAGGAADEAKDDDNKMSDVDLTAAPRVPAALTAPTAPIAPAPAAVLPPPAALAAPVPAAAAAAAAALLPPAAPAAPGSATDDPKAIVSQRSRAQCRDFVKTANGGFVILICLCVHFSCLLCCCFYRVT
jgi:hypothetical protein